MVNNLFGLTGVGRAVERGRRILKSNDIFIGNRYPSKIDIDY